MKLLGQCPAASVAGADRWTVACDANQENSFLLAPSRLVTPDLWSATATIDASGTSTGAWLVDLAFRPPDQARFTKLSRESLGKQAAFVVDGVALSAPVFQAVITGDAQISGDLDEQGARDLAAVLTGGVLPVALRVS